MQALVATLGLLTNLSKSMQLHIRQLYLIKSLFSRCKMLISCEDTNNCGEIIYLYCNISWRELHYYNAAQLYSNVVTFIVCPSIIYLQMTKPDATHYSAGGISAGTFPWCRLLCDITFTKTEISQRRS